MDFLWLAATVPSPKEGSGTPFHARRSLVGYDRTRTASRRPPANSPLAKQRHLRTLTHLTLENSFGCLDASCTTRGEWRVGCTLRSPGPLLVFSIACFAKSDCRGQGTSSGCTFQTAL